MLFNQPRRAETKFGTLFGPPTGVKRPVPAVSQRDFVRAHDSLSSVPRPLRGEAARTSVPPGAVTLGRGASSATSLPLRSSAKETFQQRQLSSNGQQRTHLAPPHLKITVDAELAKTAAASSAVADAAGKATDAAIQTLKGLPKGTSAKERLAVKKAVAKAKQAAAKAQKRAKIDAVKVQKATDLAQKKAEGLRAKEHQAAKVALLKARKVLKPAQTKAKRLHTLAQTVAALTAKKLIAIAKEKQKVEKQKGDAQEAATSAHAEYQKAAANIAALDERCRATEKPKKAMKAVIKTISKTPKHAMKARR